MDRHPGVLEQRIQALPIGGGLASRELEKGPAHDGYQPQHDERQIQEEHRRPGQRMAHAHEDEPEGRGDQRPQEKRAFLSTPEGRVDIVAGHRARGIRGHILIVKLVSEEDAP